jgi:hypothetical protein
MRFLVPLVANEAEAKRVFSQANCQNVATPLNPIGQLNTDLSNMFCSYILDKVLAPAEAKASFNPTGDFAKLYNIDNTAQSGSGPRADFFSRTGAGRLAISVINYRRFLRALVLGELLPKPVVQSMLKGDLGFDPPAVGRAGTYYTKNGGIDRNGIAGQAQLMIYPSGVIAYVMANSDVRGSLKSLLTRAFDDALK